MRKYGPALALILFQSGFAVMVILIKVAFRRGMSPTIFVTYRQLIATLSIAPFAYFLERYSLSLNIILGIMQENQTSPVPENSGSHLRNWTNGGSSSPNIILLWAFLHFINFCSRNIESPTGYYFCIGHYHKNGESKCKEYKGTSKDCGYHNLC
ncbi:WAT1-related protein At1g09380-like isoform X2 [Amborella trichopoda]|uniref:WAT1-related protein At1g09380-like isoform X2 n=1 Tax=Amborella trichopoda TaxID=13333 RepID=UPI0009BCC21E|nr:WAT1-related protein At1g09380-like isoform X2 [Amborella trichopoda]|eukprot:XP_020530774.1 WAT1-related protein At1g09380-like isoform X2 [Amborella trichopoda]